MNKLLRANLSRLWNYKPFWITLLIMIGIEVLISYSLISQGGVQIDLLIFVVLLTVGILSAFYLSLFYGTEFSDGTIRNKVIAGNQRWIIYVANLLTGIIATSFIYFGSIISGILVSSKSIILNYDVYHFIATCSAGWFTCIAITSVFNLIGMLTVSKSRASTSSIIVSFLLLFTGLICYSISSQGMSLNSLDYVVGFLFDVNPFVQGVQLLSVDYATIFKLGFYSFIISLILNVFGIYKFSNKDIK